MLKNKKGFTLIELMIVVAIIGILAAIAIPAFVKYLKQTKTSEASLNLKTLADGASSYFQSEQYDNTGDPVNRQFPTDNYTTTAAATSAVPSAVPKATKTDIGDKFESAPWQALKFSISKPVYYRYSYKATNASGTSQDSFVSYAEGDLDGDTTTSKFNVDGSASITGEMQITPVYQQDSSTELE